MPAAVEWSYHRMNCESCSKAKSFLDERGIVPSEMVNARKIPISSDEALELLSQIDMLFVVRGQKVYEFDMRQARPERSELESLIIGRSGSLRAPSLRIQNAFVVGFEKQLYARLLG